MPKAFGFRHPHSHTHNFAPWRLCETPATPTTRLPCPPETCAALETRSLKREALKPPQALPTHLRKSASSQGLDLRKEWRRESTTHTLNLTPTQSPKICVICEKALLFRVFASLRDPRVQPRILTLDDFDKRNRLKVSVEL